MFCGSVPLFVPLKKSKVKMRGFQVCLLLATCIVIKAGYIGYSNVAGYGYYPAYSAGYRSSHKEDTSGFQGDYYAYPKYSYDYSVNDPHTGDHKSKWETRDGDVVKGAYSLAEPDGTTRLVEYTADKHNGFKAVVKRIGKAYHPKVYQKQYVPTGYYGYH